MSATAAPAAGPSAFISRAISQFNSRAFLLAQASAPPLSFPSGAKGRFLSSHDLESLRPEAPERLWHRSDFNAHRPATQRATKPQPFHSEPGGQHPLQLARVEFPYVRGLQHDSPPQPQRKPLRP